MVRSPARTRAIMTPAADEPGHRPRFLAPAPAPYDVALRRPDRLRLRVQPVGRRRLDR